MTFDEWFEEYEPIENKDGDSGLMIDDRCYFFETYGKELDAVLEANKKDPGTVWTVVEGDDGELYVGDGYHYVNRIGYMITKKSYQGGGLSFPFGD
jgi:hypothetical protein